MTKGISNATEENSTRAIKPLSIYVNQIILKEQFIYVFFNNDVLDFYWISSTILDTRDIA